MNTFGKILSTALLGAALAVAPQVALAAPAAPAAQWSFTAAQQAANQKATGYKDVPSWYWGYTEGWTTYVTQHGLMSGTTATAADGTSKPTGNFAPETSITRGEVATVLYRIAHPGTKDTTFEANVGIKLDFTVQGDYIYYNKAINWAKSVGIVTGDTDGLGHQLGVFRPDDPITREELATMIYRFAIWHGADAIDLNTEAFYEAPDHNDVSVFARIPLKWTAAKGIMTGSKGPDGGKLLPHRDTKRAEAAKMFSVLDSKVL